MKTIQIQIPNMQSAHCQMRVNTAIKGVQGVHIENIDSGLAEINLENPQQEEEVIKAITDAGYTVSGVEQVGHQDNSDVTFQFKTNINCGGCVSQVTTTLDEAAGICHWSVDTANPDKILTVHSEGITEEEVIQLVEKSGFKIQTIHN